MKKGVFFIPIGNRKSFIAWKFPIEKIDGIYIKYSLEQFTIKIQLDWASHD